MDKDISVAAMAFHNFLVALFKFIDEEIEPKNLGVITVEKSKVVIERVGLYEGFACTLVSASF